MKGGVEKMEKKIEKKIEKKEVKQIDAKKVREIGQIMAGRKLLILMYSKSDIKVW